MSYILDALKQNEVATGSPLVAQGDYQQEYLLNKKLRFYRNLALMLGFLLTLSLGFFVGKTIQQRSSENTEDVTETSTNTQAEQPNLSATPIIQPQALANTGNVQYQFIPVPVYTQPTQPPQHAVQTTPNQVTEKQNAAQNTELAISAEPASTDEADLSEYKVVGYQQQERSESNALIDAFSEAFEQAQNEPDEQRVISSSTTSADVTPIDLLPESFKARLPSIQYQAHVFASEASRSWIKINGKELKVGDNFNGVYIIEIAAEQTLMQYDGIEFTLSAMDDWYY